MKKLMAFPMVLLSILLIVSAVACGSGSSQLNCPNDAITALNNYMADLATSHGMDVLAAFNQVLSSGEIAYYHDAYIGDTPAWQVTYYLPKNQVDGNALLAPIFQYSPWCLEDCVESDGNSNCVATSRNCHASRCSSSSNGYYDMEWYISYDGTQIFPMSQTGYDNALRFQMELLDSN